MKIETNSGPMDPSAHCGNEPEDALNMSPVQTARYSLQMSLEGESETAPRRVYTSTEDTRHR